MIVQKIFVGSFPNKAKHVAWLKIWVSASCELNRTKIEGVTLAALEKVTAEDAWPCEQNNCISSLVNIIITPQIHYIDETTLQGLGGGLDGERRRLGNTLLSC